MVPRMLADLRFAVRSLAKAPGFTVLVVLTLALGVGVNTAFFSVLNGILLRPLSYDEPERVMTLWESSPQMGIEQEQVSGGMYQDWRASTETFEEMAAYRYSGHVLSDVDEPVRITSVQITPSTFAVLGTRPAIGAPFDAEESDASNGHLAVLSHGFWTRQYGGDTAIVGSSILLDGEPYTVLGVMPEKFEFPPDDATVALWTPLNINPRSAQVRSMRVYNVVGRLAPDTAPAVARAELEAVTAEVARQFPDSNRGWTANVTSAREQIVGDARPLLAVLVGAATFVLLIACVNIANLSLARSAERQNDFAIRAALGAGRGRLIRRSLLESLVLASAGGLAGLVVAFWGVGFLRSVIPADVPRLREVGIDVTVVAFTAFSALAAGVVFGLVPAIRAMRPTLSSVLQEDSRGAAGGHRSRRLLDLMVAAEVCLALVLFVGAGLMVRSFSRITSIDPGFRTENVLSVALSLPQTTYAAPPRMQQFFSDLLSDINEIPGVVGAGAVTSLPMSAVGQAFDLPFQIEGEEEMAQAERPRAEYRSVMPGYFRALGIPLVRGRLISESDWAENVPVMVVNETMAKLYFSGEDPLGQFLGVPMAGRIEIVGIVGDVRHSGLQSDVQPEMFVSYRQFSLRDMHVVIRTEGDPAATAAVVRERIRALDPTLPVTQVATMEQLITASLAQPRFNMVLFVGLAACALLLAAVGIYGVVSYSVVQRTGEIGVRMALGADAGATRTLVIRQALVVTLIGIGAGLVASFGVTRLMLGLIYGVSPNDPLTLLASSAVLIAVAAAAAAVPAGRATRVDPVVALRAE